VSRPKWTVSIDTGGTFTDAIARNENGEIVETKVSSTPEDPSRGLFDALNKLADLGVDREAVSLVCHGTTVATNATLTGNLARVALVATEGYRDVLGYRQSNRPDVYSLTPHRPMDLVSRDLRFEVPERLDSAGRVITPLTDAAIARLVSELKQADPQAIAVSLLFSYLNVDHERQLGRALREAFPDIPVTLSSEVAREFREYPRTATTAINAGLRPLVEKYLLRAEQALEQSGVNAAFVVMQSNGGSVPADRAGTEAHRLVLSGPAGGVAGLAALTETTGEPNLISLDMGGTSTDVCLLRNSTMPFTTLQEIQDHTLLAPTVDIHTIGAGGGSIAWTDQTGRLRVGPQSAGAVPGPAAYGKGGTAPTITDAHVVLGTLGAGELAGELSLNLEKAREAVATVAEPLGMSIEEAAEAILSIGLAHMIRALRQVSVERGLDPRDFCLVPFGGAGPLHVGLLLRHMNLKNAIVPLRAGVFSADGLLVAGLRSDSSQTILKTSSEENDDEIATWFEKTAAADAEQLIADGVAREDISAEASVDARYRGQGFELNIPLDNWSRESIRGIPEAFHAIHAERYGHANENEPVEIVTIRLATTGKIERNADAFEPIEPKPLPEDAVIASRSVTLPGYEKASVPIIDRSRIPAGARFTGPAIIQQMDATTVVLPEQQVQAASTLDLIIKDKNHRADSEDAKGRA
jgi:N-methylhydantoinase A